MDDIAPKPMLEAVAAAEARLLAARTAALEEVYSDEPRSSSGPEAAVDEQAQGDPGPQRDRPAEGPEGDGPSRSACTASTTPWSRTTARRSAGMIAKVRHLVEVEEVDE